MSRPELLSVCSKSLRPSWPPDFVPFPVTQSLFDQNQLSVACWGAVSLGAGWVTSKLCWSSSGATRTWLMTGDRLACNLNAVCFGITFAMLTMAHASQQTNARLTGESKSQCIILYANVVLN